MARAKKLSVYLSMRIDKTASDKIEEPKTDPMHYTAKYVCENCGSYCIEKIEEPKTDPMHYTAKYVCENCGSYCIENQEWKKRLNRDNRK